MMWSYSLASAEQAREIRGKFMSYLHGLNDLTGDLFASELIFAELVGNVAMHAPGPIKIDLHWLGRSAQLSVCDNGPGFDLTAMPHLPEDGAESGRGLYLVWRLAGALKVRRTAAGENCVTTTLPLHLERARCRALPV